VTTVSTPSGSVERHFEIVALAPRFGGLPSGAAGVFRPGSWRRTRYWPVRDAEVPRLRGALGHEVAAALPAPGLGRQRQRRGEWCLVVLDRRARWCEIAKPFERPRRRALSGVEADVGSSSTRERRGGASRFGWRGGCAGPSQPESVRGERSKLEVARPTRVGINAFGDFSSGRAANCFLALGELAENFRRGTSGGAMSAVKSAMDKQPSLTASE